MGDDWDPPPPPNDTARMTGEVRVTSATGGQKGKKLERFDLIPVGALLEVARVYGKGAEKYDDRNWELGYPWSLSFAAMQRHAWAFWAGESRDSETNAHHLASVIFHAMALMEFEGRGKGTDDRSVATERPRCGCPGGVADMGCERTALDGSNVCADCVDHCE